MLVGLAGVFVPLVIHFFRLRKPVRYPFAYVWLLKQQEKAGYWRRLSELFLLVVRMVGVVLLAIAFARPVLRTGTGEAPHSTERLVLLVDNSISASVGEWNSAVKALERIVQSSGEGVLLVMCDRSSYYPSGEEAAHAFRELSPSYTGECTMGRLIRRAKSSPRDRVVIMSDFSEGFWWDTAGMFSLSGALFIEVEGMVRKNVYVDTVFIESVRWGREGWQIDGAVCIGYSGEESMALLYGYEILVGEEVIARGEVRGHKEKNSCVDVTVLIDRRGGWLPLRVRLSGDDYPADNVFYAIVEAPPRLRVAVLAGGTTPAARVVEAFASSLEGWAVPVAVGDPADVLFIAGNRQLEHALRNYRREELPPVVVFVPDREHFSRYPLRVWGSVHIGGISELPFPGTILPNSSVPEAKGLKLQKNTSLPAALCVLELTGGEPLYLTSTGVPTLVRERLTAQTFLYLWSVPAHKECTDLYTSSLFWLTTFNAVMRNTTARMEALRVGDFISVDGAHSHLYIDSIPLTVVGQPPKGTVQVPPLMPGIYQVKDEKGENLLPVAVNLHKSESFVTKRKPPPHTSPVVPSENTLSVGGLAQVDMDLWRVLVGAVLFFIVCESVIMFWKHARAIRP